MEYKEIVVYKQDELDAVPVDWHGRIIIRFGTPSKRAVVSKKYSNSSVEARGNSSVVALGNSSVVARGNSSVEARGNSSVVAWDNSSVVAWGFSQACVYSGKAENHEKARLIYPTKSINDFMVYHSIRHTKTKSVWYKAVHKQGGKYVSDHDKTFVYKIGEVAQADVCTDAGTDCASGLHIASLHWTLDFGREWKDLAILEVEVKTDDIILLKYSTGKVRVGRLKVLREIPLEECGLFGKMMARQRK